MSIAKSCTIVINKGDYRMTNTILQLRNYLVRNKIYDQFINTCLIDLKHDIHQEYIDVRKDRLRYKMLVHKNNEAMCIALSAIYKLYCSLTEQQEAKEYIKKALSIISKR